MVTRFAALSIVASALCLPANFFGADTRSANDPPVVEINGKTLTLSDLERQFPAALFQARATYYETERKTVDQFIDQYLLAEQARKENLSVDQLLEKHVNGAIAKDLSEDALHVYYDMIDTTESFAAVRQKIIDAVRDRRISKAKVAYIASLRSEAKMTLRLAPPRAPLSTNETTARGPSNARVTLVEYADYECPYCQQIQPVVDRLEQEFKGRLALVYKDFPLPMHANAEKAAEATQCAGQAGKYWDYHDRLESTKQLDVPALKSHARFLKLDGAAFDKCLDNGETAAAVKASASEAQTLGLQGTPTFFVNGRLANNSSYESLRSLIEEELSATDGKNGAPLGDESKKVNIP
jgi:protein-disulfide isomerase